MKNQKSEKKSVSELALQALNRAAEKAKKEDAEELAKQSSKAGKKAS